MFSRVCSQAAAAAAVVPVPTMKSSPSRLTLRDAKSSLYDLLAAAQHEDDAEHMHSSVLEEDDAYSSSSNSGSHPGSGRHSSAATANKYKLCDACSSSSSSSSSNSSKGGLPCGHQAAAAGHLSCLKALRDSGKRCCLISTVRTAPYMLRMVRVGYCTQIFAMKSPCGNRHRVKLEQL
jgi:hypothetical protein